MRLWKICSVGLGLGLLLILASCSESEVTRGDTEGFINSLNSLFAGAAISESSSLLQDFDGTEPPVEKLAPIGSSGASAESIGKLRDPFGLDTLYGTWRYYAGPGWVQTDPGDPADAVLFEWVHLDTSDMTEYDAYVLYDSLSFFEDTLISAMRISVGLDGSEIAWIKFGMNYLNLEEADSAFLIYEVVGYYQLGVSVATTFEVENFDSFEIDSLDFDGTIHLWGINRVTDYRVDYTITINNAPDKDDLTVELALWDDNGWRMEIDISEVVETDSTDKRRNVEGEITRNGVHAAYIDGYIWQPDDGNHGDLITIVFSDDTGGILTPYFTFFKGFLE